MIAHQIKFAGDQVEVPGEGMVECLQQVLPVSTGLHEMTVAREMPLSLLTIKLILTLINSNLSVDQVDGPVQRAGGFLQHPSSILIGSSLL